MAPSQRRDVAPRSPARRACSSSCTTDDGASGVARERIARHVREVAGGRACRAAARGTRTCRARAPSRPPRGRRAQRRSSGSSASGDGKRPSPIPHAKTTRNGSGRSGGERRDDDPFAAMPAGAAREAARAPARTPRGSRRGGSPRSTSPSACEPPQQRATAARPRRRSPGRRTPRRACRAAPPTRAIVSSASRAKRRVRHERPHEHAERRRVVQLGARHFVRHVRVAVRPRTGEPSPLASPLMKAPSASRRSPWSQLRMSRSMYVRSWSARSAPCTTPERVAPRSPPRGVHVVRATRRPRGARASAQQLRRA